MQGSMIPTRKEKRKWLFLVKIRLLGNKSMKGD